MRKLSLFTCLLFWSLSNLLASDLPLYAITYSVEANSFSTDFGNNFAYYHVNLDLIDLTRVARNGNINVVIDFQEGMEIRETRFENRPNGTIYYINDIVTPRFNAVVSDPSGNILLEKTYGGEDKQVDYGKNLRYNESELATKWLTTKDQYLQKLEFQNLDFSTLQTDLVAVLAKSPIVIPVKAKATPKPPTPRPAGTERTTATASEESKAIVESETPEKRATKEAIPINEEAAAQEDQLLKDPFGELNEPLEDSNLAETGTAPSAPIDYEEKSRKDRLNNTKEDKKMKYEERSEGITPVLSDRSNIIKLNIPNLTFGNLTLNYERLLSARNSVALNLGYIRPQKPASLLDSALNFEEGEVGEFSGLTVTAEYRIYGKKKGAGKGFYYGPYARYANHKLVFNTDIEDNLTNADTRLSAVGLGAQIGVQWLIKDRIAIDWGIIGVAAQWYNFSSTFTAVGDEINFDEVRAELEREINDSPLSNKLEFTSTENSLQAKMPFLFGGARTYISIGYKF